VRRKIGARDWRLGKLPAQGRVSGFFVRSLQFTILSRLDGPLARGGRYGSSGTPTRSVSAPMIGVMLPSY